VVFIRSDWSKRWPDPKLAEETKFPGVKLEALQFLHEQRHILFHGHEPLDTDTTPTLEGEAWLMHHGYAQAEGVANLDRVPETGALIAIGYPKLKGGTGGYARYVAIVRPIGDSAPVSGPPMRHYPNRRDSCIGMTKPARAYGDLLRPERIHEAVHSPASPRLRSICRHSDRHRAAEHTRADGFPASNAST
jgi:hypothetical protein